MNNDTNNNIHSDDYNNMENQEQEDNDDTDMKQVWGTWEELLLACAVKRHGFTNWDSVATEVRSRTSVLTSANNCKQRYEDLKRRFNNNNNIPWIEELRSLRVAELRRDVQRYDDSILSLEKKVKRLEEEEEERKPDLESEDRSMNESNSTGTGESGGDDKPDPDPEGSESGTVWKRRRRKSKSQPLIGLLDLIRSHPRGSLFERRLRSQESKEYKSLIKQHLDIEIIQRKLKKGTYDSSSLLFYRDLQLLFTNAIVYFPSSSSESMAAHELRAVVSKEMRKENGKCAPRLRNKETLVIDGAKADAETSDSSLSRPKSSAPPLVFCKKRKTVSAKASPSSSSSSQKEETKEEVLSEEKENNVSGVRSSRRAGKGVAGALNKLGKGKNKQKQEESKTNSLNDNNNSSKQETGKTEKKVVSSDKKKSMADFLKRLKKNSPQKEDKDQNKSSGSGKKESKTKPRELRSSVGKKKADVESTPVKRAPGRPQKKTAEAAAATALGKRGRESGSTGKDNKQPKKRSKR